MKQDIASLREISGLSEEVISDDDLVRVNALLKHLAVIICDDYARYLETLPDDGAQATETDNDGEISKYIRWLGEDQSRNN